MEEGTIFKSQSSSSAPTNDDVPEPAAQTPQEPSVPEFSTHHSEPHISPTVPETASSQPPPLEFESKPPTLPVTPPPPPQPSPVPPAPLAPPVPPAPPGIDNSEGFSSRFPLKRILKLGAVIAVVLFLFLIIVNVILPRFNKPKQENVTLSYWGLWEDQNVMGVAISEFERENPKIKIDYKKQDPKEYRERLLARMQNGTGPDIFRFHNTWYPMLKTTLLPLPNSVITKEEFTSSFYKVAQEDLVRNGAIIGIPLEIDTLSLFVNQDLLGGTTPPVTWQEFIEKSTSLTKRDENGKIDISGAAIGTFENISHAPDIISLLFVQNGVNMADMSQSAQRVSDALKFYTNFALIEENVWDQTLDPSLLAFSKGKVVMAFGYSWDYFTVKALNPNLNLKIYPVPQLQKDKNVNIASYWVEGVSSKSKNQKEALLFMKFLARKEIQEKLYAEQTKTRPFGEPYSNQTLADKLSGSDAFVFVNQAKTAKSSPFVDSTYDNGLNDKLNNYLKDSVNAILTNTSAESAAETLTKGYTQVLGQYGK